ncbi:MAG: helix-turn-helix domain-containing protein [Candidatus Omnitrophota bacterium]
MAKRENIMENPGGRVRKKVVKEKEPMDAAPGTETSGQQLRRLREAKGLRLEDVHEKTKIHARIIKELEEDAAAYMAPAYIKGLLKIYCAFLGVDPKGFFEEKVKEEPKKSDIKDVPINGRISSPLTEPKLDNPSIKKPGIAAQKRTLRNPEVALRNIAFGKNKVKIKSLIFVISLLILAVFPFLIGKKISVYRASRLNKSVPVKAVPAPGGSFSAAVITGKPRLGIRAKRDCWLEVKTDGKTVFRNVLKKSYFEYWEAKEKIEFSLGNAGDVEVEVNGKMLPSLGRRGQVIKNIIITKEGLMVPE